MVAFFTPPPFMKRASAGLSAVYRDGGRNGTDLTTYNFSVPLGADAATRVLIVGVTGRHNTNTVFPTVTVNGVTATALSLFNGGFNTKACLYAVALPTGNVANIAVSFSTAATRCAACLWETVGLLSLTPISSGGASTQPLTVNLTTQAGGAVFAVSEFYPYSDSVWTGASEDFDLSYVDGGLTLSQSGASALTPASGSLSVINAMVSGVTAAAMSAVSLR